MYQQLLSNKVWSFQGFILFSVYDFSRNSHLFSCFQCYWYANNSHRYLAKVGYVSFELQADLADDFLSPSEFLNIIKVIIIFQC